MSRTWHHKSDGQRRKEMAWWWSSPPGVRRPWYSRMRFQPVPAWYRRWRNRLYRVRANRAVRDGRDVPKQQRDAVMYW